MRKSSFLVASMSLGLLLVCGVAWAQGAEELGGGDTTLPTVISTIPTHRATCVNPTANVSAIFSEEMKATSIDRTTVRLYQKGSTTRVATSVSYGTERDSAIIDPTDPLEGGVTYRAVVTTFVTDLAGNRLDQDGTLTGLQRKAWNFTVRPGSDSPVTCMQVAAQIDLRNAATAASACAADNNGSYVNCVTIAQLQPYGFNPTTGVVVNGINGDAVDWSASMQHSGGGSAYTYATFGDNAGQVIEAPRGTSAPALPDTTEWEAIAQSDLRNAATAANACATDNDSSYADCGNMSILVEDYGFTPSDGTTVEITLATDERWVSRSQHMHGGMAFQYDTATGQIEPIPRF